MMRLPARATLVGLGSALLTVLVVAGCASAPTSLKYLYTRSEATWLVTDEAHRYGVLVPRIREIWIGSDGSGRLREERGQPIFLGEASRAEWNGANPLSGTADEAFKPGDLSMVDTKALSTDAERLRDQLLEGKGDKEQDAEVILTNALAYLRETGAPISLSRAIISVVRATPGVDSEAGVMDARGRSGDAFSVEVVGRDARGRALRSKLLMIVDSTNGTLLEEQRILVDPNLVIDAEPGAVFGRVTYLAAATTTGTNERP